MQFILSDKAKNQIKIKLDSLPEKDKKELKNKIINILKHINKE